MSKPILIEFWGDRFEVFERDGQWVSRQTNDYEHAPGPNEVHEHDYNTYDEARASCYETLEEFVKMWAEAEAENKLDDLWDPYYGESA